MGNIGSGSGSSYPGTLDTQTAVEVDSPNASKTKARAAVPNDLAAAVIAVETALGINPQGSKTDVKTFLQTQHNADGTHGTVTAGATTVTTLNTFPISATAAASTIPVSTANSDLVGWCRSIAFSTAGVAINQGATQYMPLAGTVETSALGSENLAQNIAPSSGTVKSLYFQAVGANSLSGNLTVTLRKNGVDAALTVTVTGGSTAVFSDTTHTVSFVAGDLLNWKLVAAGGSGQASDLAIGAIITNI